MSSPAVFTFFKFYFFLLLFLTGFFIIGHFAAKPLRKYLIMQGFYMRLFFKTLLGLTLFVVGYSVFITGAKTINLALLLVFLFLIAEFYLYKKKNGIAFRLPVHADNLPEGNNKAQKITGLFILSFLIYSWFACILINPQSEFGFYLPDKGKIYYAGIADMLSTGQENRWGVNNVLSDYYKGVAPYHYFELWMANLFSTSTKTPSVIALYVFVYPALNIAAAMGFLALIEKLSKVTFLKQLSVVFVLFAGGLYFNSAHPDFSYSMNFGESPMEYMGEKYVAYYPFIIFAFLLLLDGFFVPALAFLLIVPVISISTLPGLFSAYLLFGIILFCTKKILRADVLRLLIYLLVLSCFMAIFYKCLGSTENPYFVNGIFYYTDLKSFDLYSIKVFMVELIYRIWDCPLKFLVLHAVFIPVIILLFRSKKEYRPFLLFTALIYAVSLLLYGVFYKLFDGIQFYTNDFTFINVFIALSLILYAYNSTASGIYQIARLMILIPVFCLLPGKIYYAFNMHQKNISENRIYSDMYMQTVKRLAGGIKNKQLVGALFGGGANEMDVHNDDKSGISCFYLAYMPSFYPAIDLSVFDISDWSREEELAEVQKASVAQSPFTLFVNEQKKNGKFIGLDESQVDFIKKYQIKYLVISKLAHVSKGITNLIDAQITDPGSGERFVHLKYD